MATKNDILDAAQDLVQSIGANAMSYQHISERIGIRKASIHHHFPTKEGLLEALVLRYSAEFFRLVNAIGASRKNGRQKLRAYAALFEATMRDGALHKACPMGMLGAEVRTLGEGPASRVKTFYAENDRRLTAILEEGLSDGSLQFAGTAPAAAGLVFSALEGAMLVARGRGSIAYFRAVVDQLLRLLEG